MTGNTSANDPDVGLITRSEPLPHKDPVVRAAPAAPSNRVSWFLLVGLLAFSPIAFGAVEYWSIAIVELLILALAISWILGGVRRGQINLRMNTQAWANIGLLAWILVQLVMHRTLDASLTREGLLLLFDYFLIYVIVSNEYWSVRWIRRLAFAIATIGFIIAGFGIIQFFSWNGRLYWIRPIRIGTPFGPYVNHNHFAGLMELTFPIPLSLLFSKSLGRAWKALLAVFGVVITLATFMSFSRGGIMGFAFSLIAMVYLLSVRRNLKPVLIGTGLLAFFAVGSVLWLGGGRVQRAMTLEGLSQEASYIDRIRIAKDTLRIIHDHPFAGTGFGTFALAFPGHASWYTNYIIDKAHNDYLQLLSEVGLVGFSFAVLWIAGLIRSIWRMVRDRGQIFSPLRLGAFCGCLALLIHSFVDFNLQIPANAIYFAVLAALATRGEGRRKEPLPAAHLES